MLPLSEAELDPAVVQVGPPFQYLHLYSLLMCENLTLSKDQMMLLSWTSLSRVIEA